MENKSIADILTEIADTLDIQGDNPFRVRSYRNAARTIADMSQSVEALVRSGAKLEEIPGIGKVRQKELLKFFGSVEKIKEATEEELAKTPKMNRKSAQIVYHFFRKRER